jgi:hypothetical protein
MHIGRSYTAFYDICEASDEARVTDYCQLMKHTSDTDSKYLIVYRATHRVDYYCIHTPNRDTASPVSF